MSTGVNLGAWRDRTNLYISYRQSYTHHPSTKRARRFSLSTSSTHNHAAQAYRDSERAGLMSDLDTSNADAVIEMDLLPPRWLDTQDEITSQLSSIASQMKKLDGLHAKHVLPGFDDESVKAKEEREIESLTQEITRGFSTCQRAIKRIDTLVSEQQSQGGLSQADETMARNLKISLATRVGEVSTLFRKKQSAYLKKLRSLGGFASPALRASSPVIGNPYTDPALQDEQTDRSAAQSTLLATSQLQQRRTGVHDAQIAQREREIEKIAQGVIDLSNIFQELSTMVIDQGSLLDRIDYNVERTAEHVKEAEKELNVATGYQKRSTKRKILLLLVLLVVGMFILLLLKPKGRGGSAPAAPAPEPGKVEPPAALPPRRENGPDDMKSLRRRNEWKHRRRRRGSFTSSFMPS